MPEMNNVAKYMLSLRLKQEPRRALDAHIGTLKDSPHVVVTYLITFLIIGFVYVHWREVMRLRRN